MYVIHLMRPKDLADFRGLVQARARWAAERGLGQLQPAPATQRRSDAASVAMTCEGVLVAAATAAPSPAGRGGAAAVDVSRIITHPGSVYGPVAWILTTWLADRVARAGHTHLRIAVAPERLAEHLRTALGWSLDRTSVTGSGTVVRHLRRDARETPAIHAAVTDQVTPAPTLSLECRAGGLSQLRPHREVGTLDEGGRSFAAVLGKRIRPADAARQRSLAESQ
ncbi:hypothetical protein GA0115261_106808 [Streptomyces sp. OspMP-M43]|nr:hypothetical protein GA0115261_106808 [Streptomyces sp. OspMP-M43]